VCPLRRRRTFQLPSPAFHQPVCQRRGLATRPHPSQVLVRRCSRPTCLHQFPLESRPQFPAKFLCHTLRLAQRPPRAHGPPRSRLTSLARCRRRSLPKDPPWFRLRLRRGHRFLSRAPILLSGQRMSQHRSQRRSRPSDRPPRQPTCPRLHHPRGQRNFLRRFLHHGLRLPRRHSQRQRQQRHPP